jgi:hypothetical protein
LTNIEVLDQSVGFPLALPLTPSHHAGAPAAVLDKTRDLKRWSLVAWNDDVSATVGLARNLSLLVLQRGEIECLSITFVRPARGAGWVSLSAKLKSRQVPVTLLESKTFREDALAWLLDRKSRMEALFGLEISICDGGTDY